MDIPSQILKTEIFISSGHLRKVSGQATAGSFVAELREDPLPGP